MLQLRASPVLMSSAPQLQPCRGSVQYALQISLEMFAFVVEAVIPLKSVKNTKH